MLWHEELSYFDILVSEPKVDVSFVQVYVIWAENWFYFDGSDQRNKREW